MANSDMTMEIGANSLFTFMNPGCEVQEIADYDKNGDQIYFLNIRKNSSPKHFVFQVGDGLVRKYTVSRDFIKFKGYFDETTETVIEKKSVGVLDEFVNLKMNDTKFIAEYFRENGYLFKLPKTEEYTRVALADIQRIQYRMKLLQEVMQLTLKKQDKSQLLGKMSEFLLFGADCYDDKKTDDGNLYIHPFTRRMMESRNALKPFMSTTVFDLFLKRENEVEGNTDPLSGVDPYEDKDEPLLNLYLFNDAVINLYVDRRLENNSFQFIIDFWYNLLKDYSDQLELTDTRYGYRITSNVEDKLELNEHFQEALVKASKIVIKEELDYALKDIRNEVDLETLKPDFNIPDLYSALYMAIFYSSKYSINPMIIKYCEWCGKTFTVRRSNSLKKFCSRKCGNAASQEKWRKSHSTSKK